ncbi:MAG: hypothetical protein HY908_26455 [Myxococcales bacterium]|nr:hypothetical protein [Myxococcales bacterium]
MSRDPLELRVRRLLVALDASAHGLAGLEAAARLAERARSELVGLFVEDAGLLRLAASPVVRVVASAGAGPESMQVAEMERALRSRGDRARAAVREAAERAKLTFSFRVVRGEVTHEVVAASASVDVVVLPLGVSVLGRPDVAAETARRVSEQAERPVLLIRAGHALSGPTVVYDGSPEGARALAAAASLARHDGGVVTVLGVGDTEAAALGAAEAARGGLAVRGVAARVRTVLRPALGEVLMALGQVPGGALVLAAGARAAGVPLARLAERARRPIMLAR